MEIGSDETQDKKTLISEIIRTHEMDIWNLAFSLTGKFDVADDITQEVFIKLYQKFDSYRGDASVKTWLFAITRNLVTNYRRSAFFRKIILVDMIFHRNSEPSAEAEVMEKLVLQVTHQLSIEEISTLLGISEEAVKSRLYRARKKVSAMMRERR